MYKFLYYTLCIIISNLCVPSKCEVYSSFVDLQDVVKSEITLLNAVDQYIKTREENLKQLKKHLNTYRNENKIASKNVELYVSNPINAFKLIKRLSVDWKTVKNLIDTDANRQLLANISTIKKTMKFPEETDLEVIAESLFTLQEAYELDTSALAKGEINGIKYSSEFSPSDCFELGKLLYNNNHFYYSSQWMTETISKLNKTIDVSITKRDILHYSILSGMSLGLLKFKNAIPLLTNLLKLLDKESHYNSKIQQIIKIKEKEEKDNKIEANDLVGYGGMSLLLIKTFQNFKLVPKNANETYFPDMVHKLCRGEVSSSPETVAMLKCRMLRGKNPFLLIAPFKVEELYPDPKILMFHDAISESEMHTLKTLASPHLERSKVRQQGVSVVSKGRVAKTMWLHEEHISVANIEQRLSDMTGLSMEFAETLSVINYAIGGHYKPHYDFLRTAQNESSAEQRIATVIFYLNEVVQGGATVFPYLNVTVWPKKGNAIFWHNLHSSGDPDARTLHSGCPVLMGSKWIATEWILERGQEFLRPCNLQMPHMDFVL